MAGTHVVSNLVTDEKLDENSSGRNCPGTMLELLRENLEKVADHIKGINLFNN